LKIDVFETENAVSIEYLETTLETASDRESGEVYLGNTSRVEYLVTGSLGNL
jgi:hypothetical protein